MDTMAPATAPMPTKTFCAFVIRARTRLRASSLKAGAGGLAAGSGGW